MNRGEVRAQIEEVGILPSVRVTSEEQARFAAETVFAAGIPVVEITLTVPGPLDVVNQLAKRYPNVAICAGTVPDEESARRSGIHVFRCREGDSARNSQPRLPCAV
jgi:2-dehydro-3-deoxyphosphogluconate aldolase / (4S)-4-hydroxy-2-oxoglutarate aldolase